MVQIAAEALGVPVARVELVGADTDTTRDAGKTSASRQTFVSGNAGEARASAMRAEILRLANVGDGARQLRFEPAAARHAGAGGERRIDLAALARQRRRLRNRMRGDLRPADHAAGRDGQGEPYACYGSPRSRRGGGGHRLGTVRVLRITCAHDVGRAINPTQVEGQIHGGVAQGLGLALMEEYVPGRTENLHDYLIPTIGDVPPIESILIEGADPLGPYGAKGVGEPALVATAPAILNAIAHATGVAAWPRAAGDARPGARGAHIAAGEGGLRMALTPTTRIRCDACPVLCCIRPGKTGACDRYANDDGRLVRIDPHVVLERTLIAWRTLVPFRRRRLGRHDRRRADVFVTAIGAGTTYPDYKPAPFIVVVRDRRRRHGDGRDRGHLSAIAASR